MGKPRTQAQLAVNPGGSAWFLLGASPDLRLQIEATLPLHPHNGARQSPICAVVLATADLDHVVGLLSLRELQSFEVYSTPSVRRVLCEDNSLFGMLNRVPDQVKWKEITPGAEICLGAADRPVLRCQAIAVGSRFPAYVTQERSTELRSEEALVGLVLESPEGTRLGYFPAVPAVDDDLVEIIDSTDLLFFDGTFWSDDELLRVVDHGQTARQLGHVPVSSPDGSLQLLAGLRRPRKIFVHINNTNPMLDPLGIEYHTVRAAGWEIAEDGWQIQL